MLKKIDSNKFFEYLILNFLLTFSSNGYLYKIKIFINFFLNVTLGLKKLFTLRITVIICIIWFIIYKSLDLNS